MVTRNSTYLLSKCSCLSVFVALTVVGICLPIPSQASDIFLRNESTGTNWHYEMDGASIVASKQINTVSDPNWLIAGNGDYNGDGHADLLWRNSVSGMNWLYLMNGSTIISSVQINTVSDLNWKIAGSGDYNCDGNSDILWRNSATGSNWMYLMSGATRLASQAVNTVSDPAWKIVPTDGGRCGSGPTQYAIGDAGPAGGLVFFVTEGGFSGLEAAPSDQSSSAAWGCVGFLIDGANGTAVGTGSQNTLDTSAACVTEGIAARIADDYVLGQYSDWFLPSKDELNLMYANLKLAGLGGFAEAYYWSSSESGSGGAWGQIFSNGLQLEFTKPNTFRVRAVRAF